MSHQIRHLSFGTYFPGMRNPLDNTSKHSADGAAEARYMIKVVPSAYEALNGSVTYSNLFSVTEHFHPLHWHSGQHQLPGVFLAYDISGMKVLGLGRGLGLGLGLALALALALGLGSGFYTEPWPLSVPPPLTPTPLPAPHPDRSASPSSTAPRSRARWRASARWSAA